MVGVEISRLRDSFLVSDAGGARREAGLLGGERTFAQIAREIAERFGVRFDRNMFFDIDVPGDALVVAVVAVANAAKIAVENTALNLASVQHADYRAHLWERLDRVYGPTAVSRKRTFKGSSSEIWEFDAAIKMGSQLTLFELVVPYANAVNSAITKFLDIQDLGTSAPNRIAVLTDIEKTPHLAVLARTARYIPVQASDEDYRRAA
ncbi:MAG: hypothetical protein JO328_06390 [Hyphomicrobiales bacterium]|nr:hypothetical protein [Hyphomicrobiales bacterium]MBV9426774.1 hypothetical protein [Bradyrhizobiaceae bacterium]